SRTNRASGTPNGSSRSSWVICSTSRRPSRIRRSTAGSRAALTSVSTASSNATTSITSGTRSPITPRTVRRASTTEWSRLPLPSRGRARMARPARKRSRSGKAKGRTMADDGKIIEIEVLRYRPEQDKEPFFQSYRVPFTDDMSVLQGLQYIKDQLDGTLSLRWSCRMAICGSCGAMINGIPKLGCKTFLRDYHPRKLRVEPLAHFPIERDLVVGVEDFIGKLERIKPYIV